jgi:SulP family sulfate permease
MTESYSISKIVAKNTKQKVDYDQEFIGQGLANIATSFFQGYPVCGSFSGTSVNWSSGARTGLSLVIFSFLALLAITVLTPLFYYLPKFMLAVIVILAVMKLFKPMQMLEIYRINKYDGIVAGVTFSVSILSKPDEGIIVGVLLALVFYVWNTMHTRVYLMNKDLETGYFLTHKDMKKSSCPQVVFVKPEGPFIYVNAERNRDEVLKIMEEHQEAKTLIMDMAAVYSVDASGAETLHDVYEEMEVKGVTIEMIHVDEDLLNALKELGLESKISMNVTKKEALSNAMKALDSDVCKECNNDVFEECKKEAV